MSEKTNRIAEELEKWERGALKKSLEKGREREWLEAKRLYTPLDFCGSEEDYVNKIGFPGQFPFTRGIQPTMYRGRFWTMRSYSGLATAEETNRRYRYLLAQGVTGLSVAFDLPTQIGYDSDHSASEGEVGKVGVAIDSLQDMEDLFQGIPLGKVSTMTTMHRRQSCLHTRRWRKQGFKAEELNGTIQNDVLKEYIARGTYIYPLSPACASTISSSTAINISPSGIISIGAYHIRKPRRVRPGNQVLPSPTLLPILRRPWKRSEH